MSTLNRSFYCYAIFELKNTVAYKVLCIMVKCCLLVLRETSCVLSLLETTQEWNLSLLGGESVCLSVWIVQGQDLMSTRQPFSRSQPFSCEQRFAPFYQLWNTKIFGWPFFSEADFFFPFFWVALWIYFLFVTLEHCPCYEVIRRGCSADCTLWHRSTSWF